MKEKYNETNDKLFWDVTIDFTNEQAFIWPEIIIAFIDFEDS